MAIPFTEIIEWIAPDPNLLMCTQFAITSVTLPEEVKEYYDKVTGMNMVSDLNKFQKFNMAVATSAENTPVHSVMQQGAGMAMFLNQFLQQQQPYPDDTVVKLQKLKEKQSATLPVSIAYEAFKKTKEGKSNKKIDGFTPDQRFFLNWAQVWRANTYKLTQPLQ